MAVREEEVVRPHMCAPKLLRCMVPQQSWGTLYNYLIDPPFALSLDILEPFVPHVNRYHGFFYVILYVII
jgi:hypothetical protein